MYFCIKRDVIYFIHDLGGSSLDPSCRLDLVVIPANKFLTKYNYDSRGGGGAYNR